MSRRRWLQSECSGPTMASRTRPHSSFSSISLWIWSLSLLDSWSQDGCYCFRHHIFIQRHSKTIRKAVPFSSSLLIDFPEASLCISLWPHWPTLDHTLKPKLQIKLRNKRLVWSAFMLRGNLYPKQTSPVGWPSHPGFKSEISWFYTFSVPQVPATGRT